MRTVVAATLVALCYLLSDWTSHEGSAENAEQTPFGMGEVRSPCGVHRGGGELGGRHAESFDLLPIGTTIGGDVAGGRREGRSGPYQAAGGGGIRMELDEWMVGNVHAADGSGAE